MAIPESQLDGLTRSQREFVLAIDANTGLEYVSTGVCGSCPECQRDYHMSPSFSWHSCAVCGSSLGGNRSAAHAVDSDGALVHLGGACEDCVLYLANGDLPEQWEE